MDEKEPPLQVAMVMLFLLSAFGFFGLAAANCWRLGHAPEATFDDYLGFTLVGLAATAVVSALIARNLRPR